MEAKHQIVVDPVRNVNRKVGKCIQKYNLIAAGDRILVGLSGGKDSLALLETLAGRRKYHATKYDLSAAHISLKSQSYYIDIESLHAFCQRLDVPFIHRTLDIDLNETRDNNPCFVCSWNRRKALFRIAQELGYNKLALGHHADDAIETLLMNMVFQSSISSLPASLSFFDGRLTLIRPLLLLTNAELETFARAKNYRSELKTCTFNGDSKRADIKMIINHLSDLTPHARSNIFAAMQNIKTDSLP